MVSSNGRDGVAVGDDQIVLNRAKLLAVGLCVTAAMVFVGRTAIDVVLGEPVFSDGVIGFADAPDVVILDMIFTGLPFYVLAGLGEKRRGIWAASIGLTLVTQGYAAWQIWQDSLTGFAGGANIGLGLIMMGAPVVIAIGVIAYSFVTRYE